MITDYEQLPKEVRYIINSFDDSKDTYKEMDRISEELEGQDWYMDYDLAGEITELYQKQYDEFERLKIKDVED